MSRAMPSRQAVLELTLADGSQIRRHVRSVLGTAETPMTRAQVGEKCLPLLSPVVGARRAGRLCETVWALEELSDVRVLGQLLVA